MELEKAYVCVSFVEVEKNGDQFPDHIIITTNMQRPLP